MDDGAGRSRRPLSPARFAGWVAAALCASFVAEALVRHWSATRHALGGANPGWLVLGCALAALAMLAVALPWRAAQRLVGPTLSWFDTLTLYFQGEIGKYVPGGVWAVVGRAELARRRAGLSRAVAYAGVALSLAALGLACGVVAAVAGAGRVSWLLLLVVPVGLGLLHPRVGGRVVARVAGVDPPRWADVVVLVAAYLPAWVLVSAATLAVTRSVTPDLDVGRIVLATTLGWLAGFVAVGAPGGLGVREAVFVSLATGMPNGVALAAALLARLAFVVADAMGAVFATAARATRTGARPSG